MFENIKYFIQRGRRGWSDEDAWDIDHYLARIIPPMVRRIGKDGMGCPEEFFDNTCKNDECHKWKEILEEIAQGFEAAEQIKNLSFGFRWEKENGIYDMKVKEEKQKQLAAKFDRGMELFSKYFLNLWD
jgi:hypothetical protein